MEGARALGFVVAPGIGSAITRYLSYRCTDYKDWYLALNKPKWTPPQKAFPIVWNTLYASMGYASYLVWKEGGGFGGDAQLPLILYGSNLALNWAWSPLFFRYHKIGHSLCLIGALLGSSVAVVYTFHKVHCTAGLLVAPYTAWLVLAASLNCWIWRNNPKEGPTIKELKE